MRRCEGGFTLIEMLIALALFAMISLAGLGLVESVLGTQARTQGRLDRLADLQRAMFLVSRDFEQLGDALAMADDGVTLSRRGAAGTDIAIRYSVDDAVLHRTIAVGARTHAQALIDHVGAARWTFFLRDAGWLDRWPPPNVAANVRPDAIALDLVLAPVDGFPGGAVRRLVLLPARP